MSKRAHPRDEWLRHNKVCCAQSTTLERTPLFETTQRT